jgi:hypothetical protein
MLPIGEKTERNSLATTKEGAPNFKHSAIFRRGGHSSLAQPATRAPLGWSRQGSISRTRRPSSPASPQVSYSLRHNVLLPSCHLPLRLLLLHGLPQTASQSHLQPPLLPCPQTTPPRLLSPSIPLRPIYIHAHRKSWPGRRCAPARHAAYAPSAKAPQCSVLPRAGGRVGVCGCVVWCVCVSAGGNVCVCVCVCRRRQCVCVWPPEAMCVCVC